MSKIYKQFGIPPNRANIRVTGALIPTEAVQTDLQQMGLTAGELSPIDWRKKALLSPPRNQQDCGDCWAMSSTSALTDRFIIQKHLTGLLLEPAVTAQCVPAGENDQVNQGCQGGQPMEAGKYFERVGVPAVSGDCPEWSKICPAAGECGLPQCSQIKSTCANVTIYRAKSGSTANLTTVNSQNNVDPDMTIVNIKKELLNGPVVGCFMVPIDFMISQVYKWDLTNGIFITGAYNSYIQKNYPDFLMQAAKSEAVANPSLQSFVGGHAVEVVGWDVGDAGGSFGKIPYWIVKNSWGSGWMDGGYYKIAMSTSGHNSKLGFDVPVPMSGGLFGGFVKFDPDLSTGAPAGTNVSSSNSDKKILIIVGIAVAGLILVYILYRIATKRG